MIMKKQMILFWMMTFFSGLEANLSPCCPSGSSCTKVFSAVGQFILPGEPVLLEKISVQSHEVDLSFASTFGMILFNRSGVYKIVWYGETRSSFNWTLGFSLDGTIILGNIYGNSGCHSSVEEFEGSLVLSINAGQVLRFVNASSHPIQLVPNKIGSHLPQSSFTVCLSLFDRIY
jgi:hypothetical protein